MADTHSEWTGDGRRRGASAHTTFGASQRIELSHFAVQRPERSRCWRPAAARSVGRHYSFTDPSDPCVERETTIADDVPAHAKGVKAIKEFLIVTLQPK